jgi:hypothetical protein
MHRTIHAALTLLLVAPLSGCASTPTRATPAEPPSRTPRPVAILNGYAIQREAIQPALDELGGDEVLRELILDRALEQRCADAGIEITNDLLAQERSLLGETLGFDENATLSTDVLDNLRAQRGLGPIRYEQLLRRSAMLRALVAGATPTDAQIDRALQNAFGVSYRVRLFVSDRSEVAQEMRTRVGASDPEGMPWVFAEQCAAASIHPSAARGGLIDSLSPISLGYPSALLSALTQTPPGTCSKVLSTESGFVVFFVERVNPARSPSNAERDRVLTQLGLDTQRIAMQRLAQEILDDQEMIVMDRSLHWAWTNRP